MYLRWTRFVFFHITSALCITVVGLASKALKDGLDKKALARRTLPGATLHIADALGSGGGVTAAAGVASLLCLAMNLLGHFRPRQPETKRSIMIKEAAFAFSVIFWIATLIPATVICATKSGVITRPGTPQAVIDQLVRLSGQNLAYSAQKWIKAYLIVGWFAFLSTVINLVLVSLAARHAHKYGFDGNQGALVGHHEEIKGTNSHLSEKHSNGVVHSDVNGHSTTTNGVDPLHQQRV